MKAVTGYLVALCLALPAAASAVPQHYGGTLTIREVSGQSCKTGDDAAVRTIELVIEQGGGEVRGMLFGPEIASGRIRGAQLEQLEVVYSFYEPQLATGHRLSLSLAGATATGRLQEQHLDPQADGCNFDLADLQLTRRDDDATRVLARAEQEWRAASLRQAGRHWYDLQEWDKAIPLYEQALALLEEASSGTGANLPGFINSLVRAYGNAGRLADARRLLDQGLQRFAGAPEALSALTSSNEWLSELEADQLFSSGKEFERQGRYAEAETLYQSALVLLENTFGAEHPVVGIILHNLAGLYETTARYAEAEPLYLRALAIGEKALGTEHPNVATILNNLAGLYIATGHYAEAEPLYQRDLAISEKALGAEHPDVATTLNNLAELYKETGRYAEAEPLFRRALTIREKTLGAEHPDVATTLNNLAELYKATGRYAEAEPLYLRALAIKEKALGAEHPGVATILNNLAGLYEETGCYAAAEPSYLRALAIREKALGTGHPDVATTLNNLAGLYIATGRYAAAVPLYQRDLAILEKTLSAEHPAVATNLNNLASLYETTGRYAAAEPHYLRALAIREKALGAEHPDVAITLNNLAGLYVDMGRYAEAESLYLRALAIREKALGTGHPDMANTLSNLAGLYKATGRYAEAGTLYRRALAIKEKSLGAEHPDVAIILNNLAGLYKATGRYAEAESLYLRDLAISEKALGAEHPDVANTLNNLARLYEATRRQAEAEPLYRRALAIKVKALGNEHPNVAFILNNLAGLYETTGRYAEAEQHCQRALRIAQRAGNPALLRSVQGNFTTLLETSGRAEAAIFFGKAQVNTIQGMRQNVAGLGKETLRSFDGTVEESYRRLARLLVAQGRLPEAERVLELLKEQEYFQFVQRNASAEPLAGRAPLTSFEAAQQRRLAEAGTPLAALYAELKPLEELKLRTPVEEARVKELNAKLDAASAAFAAILDQVVATLGSARADKGEDLKESQALQETLRELGAGTVALYTVVDSESYALILITPDYRRAYTVKVGAVELAAKIEGFRAQLRNPALDPRPLGAELCNILLPPEARRELEQVRAVTLMWHLDGPLRYLPLAALYDGEHYLVERYRNTLFTTASLANLEKAPKGHWQGLGLGTSQARTVKDKAFAALDSVPAELAAVIRQGEGSGGAIPGERYLDDSFSWETLQARLKKKGAYPLVHIASHFNLEPGNDAGSFLLPGSGEPITLELIRQQNNLFGGVDLLTLSACETAYSGGKGADGREVDGLSILAQRQGAKAVVATLWPVADASTAQLMQQFYRLRETERLPKAEALRQAQLALLHGTERSAKFDATTDRGAIRLASTGNTADPAPPFMSDPEQPFSHPYFWAPFVLMGNWK